MKRNEICIFSSIYSEFSCTNIGGLFYVNKIDSILCKHSSFFKISSSQKCTIFKIESAKYHLILLSCFRGISAPSYIIGEMNSDNGTSYINDSTVIDCPLSRNLASPYLFGFYGTTKCLQYLTNFSNNLNGHTITIWWTYTPSQSKMCTMAKNKGNIIYDLQYTNHSITSDNIVENNETSQSFGLIWTDSDANGYVSDCVLINNGFKNLVGMGSTRYYVHGYNNLFFGNKFEITYQFSFSELEHIPLTHDLTHHAGYDCQTEILWTELFTKHKI